MNLREQLKEILPPILPKSPAESIKGTELIKMVKDRLTQTYSDATLRYHFSVMSCDPTSPIAKVDQGQGYYLRQSKLPVEEEQVQGSLGLASEFFETDDEFLSTSEGGRRWLSFQALYERFEETGRQFVFPVRHRNLEEVPRNYFWTVPNCAVVRWNAGGPGEEGFAIRTDLMSAMDRPFEITSVTLVLEISVENFRESIFQCLSASQWAHSAELVVAAPIADHQLVEDLSALGGRYGVGVVSLGLQIKRLDNWSPRFIRKMSADDIERMQALVTHKRISTPRPRTQDWQHLRALLDIHPNFEQLFLWLDSCRKRGEVVSYSDFEPPEALQ